MSRHLLILLLVVLFPPGMPLSIADWIWGNKDKVEPNYNEREVRNGVIFPDVPFETATSDERYAIFLWSSIFYPNIIPYLF